MNGIPEPAAVSSRAVEPVSASLHLQQLVKRLGARAAGRLGIGLSRWLGSCAGTGLGILTYHRIAPRLRGAPCPTHNVTPVHFRVQLEGLLARGYRPWPLRRVLDAAHNGRPVPRKTFVVTFDDGFESVYRRAWPVLRDLRIPATLFLATAYLDSNAPFPFDDWRAAGSKDVPAESWQPLTTRQCDEMRADGLVELGTHTHTHLVFRHRPDALHHDLCVSLDVLRSRFGLADATFAFPFGISGPTLAAAARRAGVLCALTTEQVRVKPPSDPFNWGRFNVDDADTAATLSAKLDGWYTLVRSAWQFLTRPLAAGRKRCACGPPVPGTEVG